MRLDDVHRDLQGWAGYCRYFALPLNNYTVFYFGQLILVSFFLLSYI